MENPKNRRIRFPNTRLRQIRVVFWTSWSSLMSLPLLNVIGAPFGLATITPWAIAALIFSFIGLAATSAELLKLQPRLARFGMYSIGVYFILIPWCFCWLGPITE